MIWADGRRAQDEGESMFACKSCGGTEFTAHQIVRMDIVVDGDNEYVGPVSPDCAADIYDSEEPYGPYRCVSCGAEYDELG